MYLANNIYPALVLINLMRKTDSTWHLWMAWQVLGELILSALPPSPPVLIDIELPVGTHVSAPAGHLTGAYPFPQPEADVQVPARWAGLSK